ncbi:MAG: hypothetical protein WD009_06030 [Phycisphaeraceae bacterium]
MRARSHLLNRALVALTLAIAGLPAAAAAPLADHVPADAIVYVGWQGAASGAADLDERHLGRLLERVPVRALLTESLPGVIDRMGENDPDARIAAEALAELGPVLIDRPWAFYFAGFDEQAMMPRLGLLIDAGPHRDAVAEWLDELEQQGAPVQRVEGENYIGGVMDMNWQEPADGGLAASERFGEATSPLPEPGLALAYADVEAIVTLVREQTRTVMPAHRDGDVIRPAMQPGGPDAEQVEMVLTALGVDGIETAAWAGGFDGPRWHSQAFVRAPSPRQGLVAWMMDAEPVDPASLDIVPATATWLSAGRFDVAALYEAVGGAASEIDPEAWQDARGGLAMLGMMLGVDIEAEIINALGPVWLAYRDADVAGPASMLGITLVNEVRDADQLRSALEMLMQSADAAARPDHRDQPHFRFVGSEHRGVTVYSFAFMFTQPSWAIHDNRLYVGLLPQALTRAIDFAMDGGPSIHDNERFMQVRAWLGEQAGQMHSFTDVQRAAEAVYGSTLMLGQMLPAMLVAMDADADGAALHLLPTLGELRDLLEPAGAVSWADDDGWHVRHITAFPGAEMLGHEGGGAMFVVPLGVGIMLPALGAARETARRMQSNTQARGIHQAMVMYAHGADDQMPNDIWLLLEGDYFTPEYVVSPTAGITIPHEYGAWPEQQQARWIRENASYVLIPGLVDDLNTNTVALFERPEHSDGRTIAVAYNDNHVSRVPIDEARRVIEQQTGMTLEELYQRQAGLD